MYTHCETCGKVVVVERTNNGICYCWHYVHCGWGHVADEDDIFEEIEEEIEGEK